MTTVRELCDRLLKENEPDATIAAMVWNAEDIRSICDEDGVEYSQELADDVLSQADDNQDANNGITWDTLRCYMPGGALDERRGGDSGG